MNARQLKTEGDRLAILTPSQNKTIEEYWKNINEYRDKLRFREWELLHPHREQDENIGGGSSSYISDTTGSKAILLAEDERYQYLKKIITSIDKVYNSLDEEMKEFADTRYFSSDSNYYEWEDIAYEIGVSKAKAYKMRNKLIDMTAKAIAWM